MARATAYSHFTSDELSLLRALGSEELQDRWLSALELLDGLVAPFSGTRPLPLYFDEEQGPATVKESVEKLRGTRFHERMQKNAEAAQEIRRMWERHGHTDELHAAADAFLNEMDLDYAVVTEYPDAAQAAPALPLENPQPRRRMAGGR